MKHLRDDEIQNYITSKDPAVEEHLRECKTCLETYKHYVLLDKKIRKLPEPQLSENFTHSIMSQIKPQVQPQVESGSSVIIWGYSLVAIFISLTGIAWWYGVETILSFVAGIVPSFSTGELPILTDMVLLIQKNASLFGILLFAGIILLFFGLLDKILRQYRGGRLSVFSI